MNQEHSVLPTVGVVGLGYIGLPTAAVLAGAGFQVLGLEVSPQVIETINRGAIHIEEGGLADAVEIAVSSGRLRASGVAEPRDVWLIAVPTPCRENHQPDVSIVLAAAVTLAPVLRPGDLVILESTSPVGTTEQIRDVVRQARPDLFTDGGRVLFAYCPERVLPGRIMEELISNDRSIGGLDPVSTAAAQTFYRYFVRGECVATDARTAEMVKLVENASRDIGVAFANELSVIAEELGLDVWEIIALANRHPRVSILQPGPGVGGHCIAVDPWFIVSSAPATARLIRTAREVNDSKPEFVIQRAIALLEANPQAKMACLGLTFKADTDDLRESPSLSIVARLAEIYADRLLCVDPHMRRAPPSLRDAGVALVDWNTAVAECELGLVLVDHAEFRSRGPRAPFAHFYDARGLWHAQKRVAE